MATLESDWQAEHASARSEAIAAQAIRRFALAGGAIVLAAWSLAAWAPVGVSIVTVFLFAGPHNWMEARYFLQRMPARWGPLRRFYLTAIGGAATLALAHLLLPSVARSWNFASENYLDALAVWNTALVVWIVALAHLRRKELTLANQRNKNRRDGANAEIGTDVAPWPYLFSAGWLLIAFAWLVPMGWSLALVYLHPLVALCFLDRELVRRKAPWRHAYRMGLVLLPVAIAALWWTLWKRPNLKGDGMLSWQITRHAGAGVLQHVSTHLLVATHVFLEMLHYAVWLIAIPSVGMKGQPWQLGKIPLARKSNGWSIVVAGVLAIGGVAVVGFWAGFLADYPLTRDIYFSVAILHVLAEAPFLIRLLRPAAGSQSPRAAHV